MRLRDLVVGQEVLNVTLRLDDELVRRYREATSTGETQPGETARSVPPLGVVALSLRLLLERVELPPGAIHTAQQLKTWGAFTTGEDVKSRWLVSRASRRSDAFFVNLDLRVSRDNEPALEARVSLVAPDLKA